MIAGWKFYIPHYLLPLWIKWEKHISFQWKNHLKTPYWVEIISSGLTTDYAFLASSFPFLLCVRWARASEKHLPDIIPSSFRADGDNYLQVSLGSFFWLHPVHISFHHFSVHRYGIPGNKPVVTLFKSTTSTYQIWLLSQIRWDFWLQGNQLFHLVWHSWDVWCFAWCLQICMQTSSWFTSSFHLKNYFWCKKSTYS